MMRNMRGTLANFLWVALTLLPSLTLGEGGLSKLAHRHGIPLPESLMIRPSAFWQPDDFYREYFSKPDNRIREIYISRWSYHETQLAWHPLSEQDNHYTQGSLDNYKDVKEEPLRRDFASQVLRMRLDGAVNTYLQTLTLRQLNRAHQSFKKAIDQVQNVPIRLSSVDPTDKNAQNDKTGEIHLGYDVLSDHSKVEYVKGWVDVGLFHPSLLGALTGSKEKLSLVSMSLSSNFEGIFPKATLSYPLTLLNVSASLSKALSSSVHTSLSSSTPVKDPNGLHRFEMRISYNF